MQEIEIIIRDRARGRIVNDLVPAWKSIAGVLDYHKFEYDPSAVELDGLPLDAEALAVPMQELGIVRKCRVSVVKPKKREAASCPA